MDGQGKISKATVQYVLALSNIVMIHFHSQDLVDELSLEELFETIEMIRDHDNSIKICVLLRDQTRTGLVDRNEYPRQLICLQN